MTDYDYRLLKSLCVPTQKANEEYEPLRWRLDEAMERWLQLPDAERAKLIELIDTVPENKRMTPDQITAAMSEAIADTKAAEKTFEKLSALFIAAVFPAGGDSEYCDYLNSIDYD